MLGTYWQLRALVILVLSLFVQFWEQWNINQTSKNKDTCVPPFLESGEIAWEFTVETHMSQDIILLKDPQKLFTGYQTLTWWKDVKKKTWCQIWPHLWTARAARGSCRSNIWIFMTRVLATQRLHQFMHDWHWTVHAGLYLMRPEGDFKLSSAAPKQNHTDGCCPFPV